MKRSHVTLTAAAIAVIAATGLALASGGPPPVQPADPAVDTVVSSGTGQARVVAPGARSPTRRSSAPCAPRGPGRCRARSRPPAPRPTALAAAAGLRTGAIAGIRRDTPPIGYWDQDAGRFGPGIWCGRVFGGRREVRQADGTTKRVSRFHHGCPFPKTASIRVTLTFAANPASVSPRERQRRRRHSRNAQLAWWIDGDGDGAGDPLVLVHAGVADARMWEPIVPALAAARRVVRFDMRGFGRSRSGKGPFSPADDLAALLDALADRARACRRRLVRRPRRARARRHAPRPRRIARAARRRPCPTSSRPRELLAFAEAEEAAIAVGKVDDAVEVNVRMWASESTPEVQALVADMQRDAFELQLREGAESDELDPPVSARLGADRRSRDGRLRRPRRRGLRADRAAPGRRAARRDAARDRRRGPPARARPARRGDAAHPAPPRARCTT